MAVRIINESRGKKNTIKKMVESVIDSMDFHPITRREEYFPEEVMIDMPDGRKPVSALSDYGEWIISGNKSGTYTIWYLSEYGDHRMDVNSFREALRNINDVETDNEFNFEYSDFEKVE